MSLRSRVNHLQRLRPPKESPADPMFPYVIAAEHFDVLGRNLSAIFGPPPDRDELSKRFSPEQVTDICLSHYGCREDGKLVEPPAEWIADLDRLGAMTLQDWYEAQLAHVLQYPHRIDFRLDDFGLAHYHEQIVQCEWIEYPYSK